MKDSTLLNSIIKLRNVNGILYRELNYLESTGTQYFNLGNYGWTPNKEYIECKFKFNTLASETSKTYYLYSHQGTYPKDCYNQGDGLIARCNVGGAVTIDKNIHEIIFDSGVDTGAGTGKWYMDGVDTGITFGNATAETVEFDLLRRNTGGNDKFIGNIYYFRVTKNHVPQYDLIPVERQYDSKIGMVNLVDGTFYTNAGTGEFVSGGYKKVIIGS